MRARASVGVHMATMFAPLMTGNSDVQIGNGYQWYCFNTNVYRAAR